MNPVKITVGRVGVKGIDYIGTLTGRKLRASFRVYDSSICSWHGLNVVQM